MTNGNAIAYSRALLATSHAIYSDMKHMWTHDMIHTHQASDTHVILYRHVS